MSSFQSTPLKVFISYSHDSHEHLDRVLALADRLREEGIDCNLDQYEPAPAEGWPRWMDKHFKDADFILVVCTETYCRRFEGREEQGKGLGVKWEGAIITSELYRDETINKRFIPVIFSTDDAAHVPERLRDHMRYVVTDGNDYEQLYRRLTNQPRVVRPPLGQMRILEPVNKLRALPSEERQQDFAPIEEATAPEPKGKPAPLRIIAPTKLSLPNFIEDINDAKLEMIYIPGGEFLMGSNDYDYDYDGDGYDDDDDNDDDDHDDEKPRHNVKLSPFFIGKYQITQAQLKKVMGVNLSYWEGDSLPVENVSWNGAVRFCETISKQTGKTYRLPTEAEWEYACRAGATTKYCFGDDMKSLGDYAWYYENSNGKSHPVGQKNPNAWGLFDMHGNVWEWRQDWYEKNYYSQSPSENPEGPSSGTSRALRGGSWGGNHFICRAANRGDFPPGGLDRHIGFRVVCIARTS